MNLSDLGIDPKTKQHKKNPLTAAENAFLGVLWVDHVGKENKITANSFARAFAKAFGILADVKLETWKRDIRKMQEHILFEHNIPVISKAGSGGGYWMAANREEGEQFYVTFRRRGLTGLKKATRGKQSAMVDMMTQLSFEFESLVDKTDEASEIPARRKAMPIEVVTAFLTKMTENPEQYAADLRRIGEKFGNVLIPRQRYEEVIAGLKSKMAEMNKAVERLSL